MPDLQSLEYPRHLHKADESSLIVHSWQDAAAALTEGWSVEWPVPEVRDVPDAPCEPPVVKRGPGRPKKGA